MTKIQVNAKVNQKAFDLLDQLPVIVQRKSARKAVKQAANVVAAEIRRRVPESKKTGTREKWSKKTKAKRAGDKTWKKDVRSRLSKKRDEAAAQVQSNLANIWEFGHEQVLWGKKTGKFIKPKPIMRQSIDTTKPQQDAAMIKTLQKEFREEVESFR